MTYDPSVFTQEYIGAIAPVAAIPNWIGFEDGQEMIEINLATKKQASYAAGTGTDSGTQTILGRIPISREDLDGLPIRKIILSVVACVLGSLVLDDLKEDKIKAIDKDIIAKTRDF